MYRSIQNDKPKNWIHKPELSEEQAIECNNKRKEIMKEFGKQGNYKALVEEVYLLIIAKAEQDDEFEKLKIRAYL